MQEREAPIVCDQWLVQGNSTAGCLDPTVRSSRAGVVGPMEVDRIPVEEVVHHHIGRKAVVVVVVDHSKVVVVVVDHIALAADRRSTVVGHIEAAEGKD